MKSLYHIEQTEFNLMHELSKIHLIQRYTRVSTDNTVEIKIIR